VVVPDDPTCAPRPRRDPHAPVPPEISPIAGLPGVGPDSVAALTSLTEIGDDVGIVGPFMPRLPGNWERLYKSERTQMIRTVGTSLPRGDLEVLVLGAADVAHVLALVERTRAGPFGARTIELGTTSAFVRANGWSRWPVSACGSVIAER